MADGQSPLDKLAAMATLGTRRVPVPPDLAWPDASLAAVAAGSGAAETKLLRVTAALALWEGAGIRAAVENTSAAAVDFPVPGAPLLREAAGWRLARIVGGDYAFLLHEWFELARQSGRVLPPHFLPLVLEQVPPKSRREAAVVLGPAAQWLAARHPTWLASAPVAEPSDLRWQEGSTADRVAELKAVRQVSTVRSRAWLRTTWETDPHEAREAFLQALLPTVEPQDEEFLEMALDDKRKAVRLAAAEALSRLPASAHARRNLERLAPLINLGAEPGGLLARLRKRKLTIELPTAPDKAAQRDGIELKPPAALKIGERTFWLSQMVSMVPPRHWCERFDCDADAFLQAVFTTDYKSELLFALTQATARHFDREWASLLARTWIETVEQFQSVVEAVTQLLAAAPEAERDALAESVLSWIKGDEFGYLRYVLEQLPLRWSANLTRLAFERLEKMAATDRAGYSQPRNTLDGWAKSCDPVIGQPRGLALLEKLGDHHSWRNALEQFNDIVAFRVAMKQELDT